MVKVEYQTIITSFLNQEKSGKFLKKFKKILQNPIKISFSYNRPPKIPDLCPLLNWRKYAFSGLFSSPDSWYSDILPPDTLIN
jgi:hypothetical protein